MLHGLIEFEEPFLDFFTRCNSKTYYYLMVVAKLDIPMLVHRYDYAKRLIWECEKRFSVKNAPIFFIHDYDDYYRKLAGTEYRKKGFIVDDPIVYRYCRLPKEITIYQPEEVRDLVLACLAGAV
jgi:hypothetical protein